VETTWCWWIFISIWWLPQWIRWGKWSRWYTIQKNQAEHSHQSIHDMSTISPESLMHLYEMQKENSMLENDMTNTLKYTIELLAILQSSNVSDALYNKIVKWLSQCSDLNALINLPSRGTVTKKLGKRYMMEELYPNNIECTLSTIALPIWILVHLLWTVYLTATNLMMSKNLLFADCIRPSFVPPHDPKGNLSDINTGDAYYTYYNKIPDELWKNCIVVPLMIFVDGMLIENYGRYGQEPWMYMLSIWSVHNLKQAWHNLELTRQNTRQGYSAEQINKAIGNQGRQPQSGEDCYVPPQLLDWHKQISVIFQQILQVQQFLTGMKWKFVIDGKEIDCQYSLLLPILAIMGGMPFLNKVVGMHGGLNGNYICRFCNIKRDDLDNSACNFIAKNFLPTLPEGWHETCLQLRKWVIIQSKASFMN